MVVGRPIRAGFYSDANARKKVEKRGSPRTMA
jgi:hypothetical protein